MAKILYEVKQNKVSTSVAYGKWFGHLKSLETLNTRKLAAHIAEHGSIYTSDVVFGVLEKFRSCLLEMLLNSKKVKIEGLGTFYCTLENAKGGAQKKEDYNVNKHMKALHIRFLPEQEQEQNISSREFIKQAEFINVESLLGSGDSSEDGGNTTNGGGTSDDELPTNQGSESNGSGSNTGGSGSGSSGNDGPSGGDDDGPNG